MAKILFVVPQRLNVAGFHAGGQVTAAEGLIKFASQAGHEVSIVNTNCVAENGFSKLLKKLLIIITSVCRLFLFRPSLTIVFSGGERNLLEKLPLFTFAFLFRFQLKLCLRNDRLANIGNGYRRVIARFILFLPTEIIVQGSSMQHTLNYLVNGRTAVTVVANWLKPELKVVEQPKEYDGEIVNFLFFSRVTREKGIYELIGASHILEEQGLGFRIIIAGDGDALAEAKCLAQSKNIVFRGWVSSEDARELFETCDVMILPSYREGFPNVVIEGMSFGLPPVVTPVGAVLDTVENNVHGKVVNTKDTASLAEAMKSYITQPELLFAYSKACLDVVKRRHDFSTNCGKIISSK